MAAGLPLPSTNENISTTLSTGISDVASSVDVADASKIVAPCYLVIDRVDGTGASKATSFWEYIKVTNVASNTLTITRGQGGSTAQSHSAGAVVEAIVTSSMFEDWYAALNPEHTASGGHVIGTATVNYTETKNLVAASVASIAELRLTRGIISTLTVTTLINASGASIVGISGSGTGGFNAFFGVPGGLASTTDAALHIPVPTAFTANFIVARLITPVSAASVVVNLKKNGAVIGTVGLLATATWASSASLSNTALAASDYLNIDLNVADTNSGSDLSVLLRAT